MKTRIKKTTDLFGKILLLWSILLCCSGCNVIQEIQDKTLPIYQLTPKGNLIIDGKNYEMVLSPDFTYLDKEKRPFALAEGKVDDYDVRYHLYKIKGADDTQWLYAFESGFMMNWGFLYRAEELEDPQLSNYDFDAIYLYRIKSGFFNDTKDQEETITAVKAIVDLRNILDKDPSYYNEDYEKYGLAMLYQRTVYLLSPLYPGLGYEAILFINKTDNRPYLYFDWGYYDVSSIEELLK